MGERTWRWLAPWAWGASIVLHVVAVRSLMQVRATPRPLSGAPLAPESPLPSPLQPLNLHVPFVTEISIEPEAPALVDVPHANRAGDETSKLDDGRGGHGGERRAKEQAVNMSPHDDSLRRSPDTLSHLENDQLQRVRSGPERRSWEDRRSTTHPAELTLLAVGDGDVLERRPKAAASPDRGAREAPRVAMRVAHEGAPRTPSSDAFEVRNAGDAPHERARPTVAVGLGSRPVGAEHHLEASVGNARPSVTEAPVSVVAEARGRPQDQIDSEQRVATAVESILHASARGGERAETGEGGSEGGPTIGTGGTTGGARARPLGFADGDIFDLDTADPRLVPYFRQIHAKLAPLWANAFPRTAILELKQGRVILEFTIDESGRAKVAWPPVRPSGIPEFDRNCADAIAKGSPYGALPPELGVKLLHVRAPFTADNPIIR